MRVLKEQMINENIDPLREMIIQGQVFLKDLWWNERPGSLDPAILEHVESLPERKSHV